MNDERCQIVFGTGAGQEADLLGIGQFRAPHARAGRENLEGVGAELGSFQGRALERSGRGSVNADAQALRIQRGASHTVPMAVKEIERPLGFNTRAVHTGMTPTNDPCACRADLSIDFIRV